MSCALSHCEGLYVADKTPGGFEVRELGGRSASIAFDYKIVAQPRGYEQVRREDITEKVRQQNEEREKFHPRNAVPHKAGLPTPPSAPPLANPRLIGKIQGKK